MAIYFGLITLVLLTTCFFNCTEFNPAIRQKKIAFVGMLAIFLLLSLKAPSVGIDISGYRQQYYIAKVMPWRDFDYVYFEKGYILLEKFFSKLGVSFQLYTIFLYGFETFAWYKLFSKYSKDSCLSTLFMICYQFLVFSMSGLRQAIAMAICIFAFISINRFDVKGFISCTILTAIATSIHRSALAFLFVFAAVLITNKVKRVDPINAIILLIGAFFSRGILWDFINSFFKRVDVSADISLGGAFLFQLVIFVFSLYTFYTWYGIGNTSSRSTSFSNQISYEDALTLRLSLYTVATYILLSGGVLLRGTMYVTMFMTAFLPQLIFKYTRESRVIIRVTLIVVLLYTFYTQTLAINQLGIVPYSFFWE